MTQKLISAITDLQEEEAYQLTQEMLDGGSNPLEILNASSQALNEVGKRFEAGEYFIPELIMAGEMLAQISKLVKPHLVETSVTQKLGKVVIGTVEGDIHDIAKDIVSFMLDINGFEVIDLGVDVPPEKFVETAIASGTKIVALSGFLTLAYEPMKETVKALKAAGLEDVKVMIGGGQIDEQVRTYTGADAYGRNAMTAVSLAKQWTGVLEK